MSCTINLYDRLLSFLKESNTKEFILFLYQVFYSANNFQGGGEGHSHSQYVHMCERLSKVYPISICHIQET